jgi:hypothetical protein
MTEEGPTPRLSAWPAIAVAAGSGGLSAVAVMGLTLLALRDADIFTVIAYAFFAELAAAIIAVLLAAAVLRCLRVRPAWAPIAAIVPTWLAALLAPDPDVAFVVVIFTWPSSIRFIVWASNAADCMTKRKRWLMLWAMSALLVVASAVVGRLR